MPLNYLNQEGAEYLLIGGYALMALGYQRGTTDIDLCATFPATFNRRPRNASAPLAAVEFLNYRSA